MSLRLRLLLTIGTCFALFWAISAAWMLADLRSEFRSALDERLAASARMVAALVTESPQLSTPVAPPALQPYLVRNDAVACEIRMQHGALVGRTGNSPPALGQATPGLHTRTIDGVTWRSYTFDHHGVRITTADRVDRRQQLFYDIARATFVPFAVAMAATMLALWFAVRVCLRPLARVRAALARRAPDALDPVPEQGLPAELAPLVTTVNALLGKIARTIERERRFTGDAAHELRTPLTAVKTHIQVARRSHDGTVTAAALSQAEEGVGRLHRTIDQLLMLARVEGSASFDDDEESDAATAVREAVSQLPQQQAHAVEVVDEGAGALVLSVPASLAATALRNVLDNALRHGPPGSPVVLRIAPAGGSVSFIVEDRGPGLADADLGKAGQRFWRGGHGQGSGLGLSIVNAIVARYGGSWELSPRSGGGLAARIRLPVAAP
jgi:two-component system, OmpR family, sensor histidine kinase QseC